MTKARAARTAKGAKTATRGLVDAVVMLRPPSGGSAPAPAQSRALAASVLSKAAKETGLRPDASTVFDNLHSFSVRAPKKFVEALQRASEVAQVVPNALPGSALIEPVKRTPVKLPK